MHSRKISCIAFLAVAAAMLLFVVNSVTAEAASTKATASHSLSGPITGTASNGSTFAGTFTATNFVARSGKLFAVGTVSGTLKNATGNVVSNVTNAPAALPVTSAVGTCTILTLNLGPLDLNLLGLLVHLNQVVLNVTAQAGAGNLLGNLLCSVAGLLDGGSPLTSLVSLLNQILAAL